MHETTSSDAMGHAMHHPMSHSDFSAALASLQASGAAQRDPIGFQHMVLLAQRLQAQPGAVQRILAGRLREALARAAASATEAEPTPTATPTSVPATPSPLAELHRHILAVSGGGGPAPTTATAAARSTPSTGPTGPTGLPRELKSLDRFRDTWAKVAADAQVDKALARAPENAGPLNSHLLVLRSLATLRELSPEHLHGVLAQLDALLWLEQATLKPTLKPALKAAPKPAPTAKATKARPKPAASPARRSGPAQ